MGSRKARPRKPPAPPIEDAGAAAAQADDEAAASDEHLLRPSSSMTQEVEAIYVEELLASSTATASVPKVPVVPRAATEPQILDDLAQTVEAPSAPRILIMDAAERLIAHVDFVFVTEEEVAKAANVSIDVFHAHFADKLALLRGLNERFCAQALAVTDDATRSGIWDHAEPRDLIEITVRTILDVVLGRAALVRAVLSSGHPELLAGFRQVGTNVTTQVSRVIDEMRGDDKPDKRDIAFVFLVAVSLAHHSIMIGTEWSGVDFDRDDIYERASRAVRAYLESRPRPS